MKKQLLSIIAVAMLLASSFTAKAQLTNGGLETWTDFNIFLEPDTNGIIRSLNPIVLLGGNPPQTCFRTDTAHSGQYAARIESRMFVDGNIFIPGVLGTIRPYVEGSNAGADLQKPYSGRPQTLKAWIQYVPESGDSAEIFSYVLKQNGSNFETLGVASKRLLFPVTNWEEQVLTYNYSNTTDISTHICLLFVTSKAYNFSDLFACQGQVRSRMFVDDIELTGYNGVSEMLFTGEQINVFPSPASDIVNVSITQDINNATLSVIDMNGREISTKNVSGNQFTVDASAFQSGNYIIVLQEGNKILGRKTFVKK